MSINFLHGIETIESSNIPLSVTEVRSAVIGLVGTAPTGPVNAPTVIRNAADAAQFGSFAEYGLTSGYTLPYALNAIQEYGAGTVVAVNVFEPASVDDESGDEVPNNVADVTNAQIIGSTDASGSRTGAQAFLDCFNAFGFNPKILIAPDFSEVPAVQTALVALAEKLRAVVLVDAPKGLSVAEALQARSASGSISVNSDRAYILYPHLYHYNPETDRDELIPYSAAMAGLIAKTDRDYGYWCSPSNKDLTGVAGLERNISSSYTDASCDVNRLNEKAVTSVMNAYGSGYKAYGNRLASFGDGSEGLDTFLTTRRVSDMIAEALEQAMAKYVDAPLNVAVINDIANMGQTFINTLTRRGAVVGGSCYPSSSENTAASLSQGRLVMVYEYNPPAPLERITHRLVLTNSYYES